MMRSVQINASLCRCWSQSIGFEASPHSKTLALNKSEIYLILLNFFLANHNTIRFENVALPLVQDDKFAGTTSASSDPVQR